VWCRPPRQSSTATPLPFMDGESESRGNPVLASDGDHRPDWTRIMDLTLARNPHVQAVVLGTETVLFDSARGRSVRLNAVGSVVWEHCTGTATLQQIHRAVSARLERLDDLREQILACVVQWSHDGLLDQPDRAGR
jgi:hypothetical protein